MNKLVQYLFIIISSCALNSHASFAYEKHINITNNCKTSNASSNDYEPLIFRLTNNLLRTSGSEELYCGEKIIISGVLLDKNCNPISDAKIYIWQANCHGKYPYKPLKDTVIDKKLIDINSNTSFSGNGIANTNNRGEFHFITIYPKSIHGDSPHINVRVEPYQLEPFQTKLTLKGKKVKNPTLYTELENIIEMANYSGTSIYKFEIILPQTREL